MFNPPQVTAIGLWLNMLHIEIVIVKAVTADTAASGEVATAAIQRLAAVTAGTQARFSGASLFATLHPRATALHDATRALASAPSGDAFDAVVAAFERLVEAGNALVWPTGTPAGVSIIGS